MSTGRHGQGIGIRGGGFVVTLLVLGCQLGVMGQVSIAPDEEKAAPDLVDEANALATEDSLRVVVSYKKGADAIAIALEAGAVLVDDMPEIDVVVLDLAATDLGQRLSTLLDNTNVTYIAPNRPIQSSSDPVSSSPVVSENHVRNTTGVTAVWEELGLDGSGVTVAVIDSGIYEHTDLHAWNNTDISRITKRVDFTGLLPDPTQYDPYGHGTHVAGLLAGNGQSSLATGHSFAGIAPNASLIDLRVLDPEGGGTLHDLLAALRWVKRRHEALGIKVVNLSVGTAPHDPSKRDPLCKAIRKLVRQGVTIVVAAGNHGKDQDGNTIFGGILSPAICPQVLTVGAANSFQTDARGDDGVTTYSSRGPTRSYRARDLDGDGTAALDERRYENLMKPDILAPGNRLVSTASQGSTLATEHPELMVGPDYMELSGTSMASPIVAGIVALLIQAHPEMSPDLIKAILMYTAQPLDGPNLLEQGAGLVNARAAVQLAQAVVAGASELPPGDNATPGFDLSDPSLVTSFGGETISWGRSVIYTDGWYFGQHLYRASGIDWVDGPGSDPRLVQGKGVLYGQTLDWNEGASASGSGILWADGALTVDRMLGPNDLLREAQRLGADGVLWADGILWGDGTICGDGILWSDGVLWADGYLAPDGIFWGDSIVSGDGILWADGLLVGDGILWADGVLWADGILWADSILAGDVLASAENLALSSAADNGLSLSWDELVDATQYDLSLGELEELGIYGGLSDGALPSSTELPALETSPAGEGRLSSLLAPATMTSPNLFFLVRPRFEHAAGSVGCDSAGDERLP